MDLFIFHYHFLTSGVTSVVTQAISALRQYQADRIRRICLVGGRIPSNLALESKLKVEKQVYTAIDYLEPEQALNGNMAEQGRVLAEDLQKRFASQESIWWVHNFHLGKNPVFTEALLRIIHSGSPPRIILQIHDFPECGRYQNLQLLKQTLTFPTYPVHPRVHYAVLNHRDLKTLIKAGIPAWQVSLLENPVANGVSSPRNRSALQERLAAVFSRVSGYRPQSPALLYPIRAIRRKNVLEAALITRLLGKTVNLVVTLPGISSAEQAYSELVEQGYRSGVIRGLWKIGEGLSRRGLGLEDLAMASDLVLSSSIQEGFGYLFINTLQWNLPLAARDLDILDGWRHLFVDYPAHFYQRVLVPLDPHQREAVARAYRDKIKHLRGIIPPVELEQLGTEVHQMLNEALIDFSYLPALAQYRLLEGLDSGQKQEALQQANRALLQNIQSLLRSRAPDRNSEVAQRFGYPRYADNFMGIVQKLESPRTTLKNSDTAAISQQVIRQFAKMEYLRLLYD